MRKIFLNSLGAVALAASMGAVAGAATAQVPPPPPPPAAAPPPPNDMERPFGGGPDRDADLTRAAFVDARIARLTALDADRDGTVSVAEREAAMQAKRAERADERFAKLDANSDGAISRAEFDAGRPERADGDDRGPRGERGPGRGGPRHAMRGPDGPEGPGAPGGPEGREPGPVVIAEVAAKLGERFDKMDADKNGVVTAEERRAAMPARRGERPHHRLDHRLGQQPASPPPASE
ncbi:hypothetical protein GCM10017620_03730 [Brevundimonas intermedia]|uniref:EF-hand domain-containing protein n=1 Tax=Brevundimonas intermedia TaxID=74315 RepID=A0ABQ5T5F2_9CAUL|nr:EF-hand domain-containing protein [Brevundimonas intermedia]GLK47400.1 hypothetical protein GCM10017620_03730 [Brevundimonas intermedia]